MFKKYLLVRCVNMFVHRIVYVGCRQVAAVTVGYQLSPEYTDGFTHSQPVTKLLTHPQTQTVTLFFYEPRKVLP